MEAKPKPTSKKHYDVIRPKQVKRSPKKMPAKEAVAEVTVATSPKRAAFWRTAGAAKLYALFAGLVLVATTLLWSYWGAKIQSGNADQLVDPYLFQNAATFHAAIFPGTHTFLLKWPLFVLINVLGGGGHAYIAVTMGAALVTVGVLAYLLFRIDRRPQVFGTICLALASVLLLVPTQPYPGGLLPVNMAMLETRNLEYAVYLASLAAVLSAARFRSWKFVLGSLGLIILIASDKLFMTMGLAAGLAALVLYALRRHKLEVVKTSRWLASSVIGSAGAIFGLAALRIYDVTGVSNGSAATPYALIKNLHQLALGGIYAVLSVLTNFGANPAYDATEIRQLPHKLVHGLLTLGGFAFVVNGLLLVAGVIAAWKVVRGAWRRNTEERPGVAGNMALILLASTFVALGMFVLTDHYYAVDARYVTIVLFAIFVSLAWYARQRSWVHKQLMVVVPVLLVAIGLGSVQMLRTAHTQQRVYDDVSRRNALVQQVIGQHHVRALVGNYWRVVPIRQDTGKTLTVLPLANCTTPTAALTSTKWQQQIKAESFAYLLTLDKGLTDFPTCSYNQVMLAYGRPNSSVLIDGTFAAPKEIVLFYDRGISGAPRPQRANSPGLNTPVTLTKLPKSVCPSTTTLTIVAHQDDDLLFTSPDLLHDITAGKCVRTIYVTAGDAGQDRSYWVNREQATEAAYDEMSGSGKRSWIQRVVSLSPHAYITIASPANNSKLSLVFMHLPDGNINGRGFNASRDESLQKLATGQIPFLASVDRQSTYTSGQLTDALFQLMKFYNPAEIHTQSPVDESSVYSDHSDHLAAGRYAKAAYDQYVQSGSANPDISIVYYIGYPTHDMQQNVFGDDLDKKEAAFFAYGRFDGSVCSSIEQCRDVPTYGSYLSRQYTVQDVSEAPVPVP